MNKEEILSKLGVSDDGKVGLNDIVSLILKCRDSGVNREDFLRTALQDKYSQDVIDKAVETTPTEAGLSLEDLEKLTDNAVASCLEAVNMKESLKDTVEKSKEADNLVKGAGEMVKGITQNRFLTNMIRTMQKIMYLYGMPQLEADKQGNITGKKSIMCIIMCLSVFYKVDGSEDAIKALAQLVPKLSDDDFTREKLESDVVEKIVKEWTLKFAGVQAALSVAGSNPLVGVLAQNTGFSKTIGPACIRLRDALADTCITNPNHIASEKEKEIVEQFLAN